MGPLGRHLHPAGKGLGTPLGKEGGGGGGRCLQRLYQGRRGRDRRKDILRDGGGGGGGICEIGRWGGAKMETEGDGNVEESEGRGGGGGGRREMVSCSRVTHVLLRTSSPPAVVGKGYHWRSPVTVAH